MKLNTILPLSLLLSSCLFNGCSAQDFSESMALTMESHGAMGMSALVICGGEVTEAFHAGFRDYENKWPVNSDTRFRIASVSKSITAIGCMKLAEAAVIDLETDINDYLPFVVSNANHPGVPITTRMLLSHTSSIQDGSGYSPFLTSTYQSTGNLPSLAELLEPDGLHFTANMYRTEEPGTHFAYSNLNFGLLATVMEAVTETRFDILMDSLLFDPMELGCSYDVSTLTDIENLATLYRYQDGWVAQADQYNGIAPASPELSGYEPGTNGLRFAPQGGFRASAHELHQLMALHLNNGTAFNGTVILSGESLQAMRSVEWTYNGSNGDNYYNLFNSWGLGIQNVSQAPMGDVVFQNFEMWGHPGEAYGLVSDWYFDDETQNGIIFLTNGVANGYTSGNNSAFYTIEEEVFAAAESALNCTNSMANYGDDSWKVTPNFGRPNEPIRCSPPRGTTAIHWYNVQGQCVAKSDIYAGLSVPPLPAGTYTMRCFGASNIAANLFTIQ